MKKLIPAIAFMFVLALSFAFRPAPAKAEKGKTFATVYYKYLGGTWSQVSPSDVEDCSGAGNICVIQFDNTNITPANAQSGALANINPTATAPYTVQATGGGNVTVYPRSGQ